MPSRTIAMDAPQVLSASQAIASAGVPRRVVDATRASACGGVNIETTLKPATVSDPEDRGATNPRRRRLSSTRQQRRNAETDARDASSAGHRTGRDRRPAIRPHRSGVRRRPPHRTSAMNEQLRKEVSRGRFRCPLRWPCLPAHPVAVRASVTAVHYTCDPGVWASCARPRNIAERQITPSPRTRTSAARRRLDPRASWYRRAPCLRRCRAAGGA